MLIFKLNEQRTRALPVGFLAKGEAAKRLGVFEFELLDLDNYGGMFVRADHLFISETKVVDGLRRYAPEALLNGLLNERQCAQGRPHRHRARTRRPSFQASPSVWNRRRYIWRPTPARATLT